MKPNDDRTDFDPAGRGDDPLTDNTQPSDATIDSNAPRSESDTVPERQSSEKTVDGSHNATTPTDNEDLPRSLGQYRLIAKLGEGGMGAVYLAEHERLRRPVALKMLTMERVRSAAALARFQREMAAAGQVSHPNIVVTHDAGETDGVHYMAMELIDGVDVGEMLRLGPLPVAIACEIARQTAIGLQHAHQCNLVHRDIKPSNVMVGRGAEAGPPVVKILDLGLARLDMTHELDKELTAEGQMMGTIDYMAPEQADGGEVGRWSDIYSLGATLHKMLTGVAPYSDAGRTLLEKLAAMGRGPAPSIRTRIDLPSPLADLIDAMLSPNPADRPSDAHLVAEALSKYADHAEVESLLESAKHLGANSHSADAATWSVLERHPSRSSSATAPNTRARTLATEATDDPGTQTLRWVAVAMLATGLLAIMFQSTIWEWLAPNRDATDPKGNNTPLVVAQGDASVEYDSDSTLYNKSEVNQPNENELGRQTIADSTSQSRAVGGSAAQRPLPSGPKVLEQPLDQTPQPPNTRGPLRGPQSVNPNSRLNLSTPPALPHPQPNTSTHLEVAADQAAALWFTRRGGQVQLQVRDQRLTATKELPTDRYFLLGVDSQDKAKMKDADVALFRHLTRIEKANLSSSEITDSALPKLASVRTLVELDLSNTKVTSDGMKYLAPLDRLQTLRLRNTKVDDTAVVDLAKLKSLTQLDVRDTGITNVGARELKALLPQTKIDDSN